MFYALLALFAAAIVGLDQWTKWLTIQAFPEPGLAGNHAEAIPGLFHITHIKNTGSAWGMLSGHQWLFLLIMGLFLVALVVIIRKKWITNKFELFCLAGIAGGGLGNAIDRALTGQVTDMICLDFIEFPVFNVADCFITTCAVLLIVYVLFFNKDLHKKSVQQDADPGEGAA